MEIRRLNEHDLKTRVDWMNNPSIYGSMHFDVPVSYDKTVEWFHSHEGSSRRVDLVVEDGHEIVAFCGITNVDAHISKAETYLFVDPGRQHSGIGTQAKRLLIDYAFRKFGLNKLYVVTNEDNSGSIALQRKLGYQLEGRFREEYPQVDGTRKDRLYFGLLKTDWEHHETDEERV